MSSASPILHYTVASVSHDGKFSVYAQGSAQVDDNTSVHDLLGFSQSADVRRYPGGDSIRDLNALDCVDRVNHLFVLESLGQEALVPSDLGNWGFKDKKVDHCRYYQRHVTSESRSDLERMNPDECVCVLCGA